MVSLEALAADWPALDTLLDEALAVPAGARAQWLAALDGEHARLRPTLAQLLAVQAQVDTGDFLATLPKLSHEGIEADAGEPKPGDSVGPYRLISELGRGGMGAVWLAERSDGQLKRQIALKLPRVAWGNALTERLARERDILASLEHPHIARLYEAGTDALGRPWLAMEYVEGRPIDAYCGDRDLALTDRLGLLLQVAAAVAHAHARLVVHRDLKPANILVTHTGQVRLLDFGIAKLMEGDRTEETALTRHAGHALTLDYASPEQIRGEPLGTASDVYSLAVVAYELLVGARPYRLKGSGAAELAEAIASTDPPRASDAASDPARKKALRGDLDAILNKALKKDSAERYSTVEAFAQDLQRHLEHRPVLAQPDRLAYRAAKFVSRYRIQVAAGGVVTCAVLAGSAVSLWQADHARRQAERAEAEARALEVVGNFMLGTFSRIAADPAIAGSAGREAMAAALRAELAITESQHLDKAKALAEVYGNAAAMFNYVQLQPESLAFALKELEQLRIAGEPGLKVAEAERQIALGYYRGGESGKALLHLEAGRAVLPATSDEATRTMRSRLWRATGQYLETTGRLGEAGAALEAARHELEPDLRMANHYYGSASIDLSRLLHSRGDDRRALALVDEVRGIYTGLPRLAESEWGGLELAHGFIMLGLARYAEAEVSMRKAAALYGKQFGLDGPNAASIDAWIARAVMKQGRYAEARAMIDRAQAILEGSPAFSKGPWLQRTLYSRFELELDTGDLAGASLTVGRIQALDVKRPSSQVQTLSAEARLASAQGRHELASERIAAAQALSAQHLQEADSNRRLLALTAAEIELAAGRPQAARVQLQALQTLAENPLDWSLLRAADLRAEADLRDGRVNEALAWYGSALAGLQGDTGAQRSTRNEALARLNFGSALRASGNPERAWAQTERAAALLASQHPASPLRTLLASSAR